MPSSDDNVSVELTRSDKAIGLVLRGPPATRRLASYLRGDVELQRAVLSFFQGRYTMWAGLKWGAVAVVFLPATLPQGVAAAGMVLSCLRVGVASTEAGYALSNNVRACVRQVCARGGFRVRDMYVVFIDHRRPFVLDDMQNLPSMSDEFVEQLDGILAQPGLAFQRRERSFSAPPGESFLMVMTNGWRLHELVTSVALQLLRAGDVDTTVLLRGAMPLFDVRDLFEADVRPSLFGQLGPSESVWTRAFEHVEQNRGPVRLARDCELNDGWAARMASGQCEREAAFEHLWWLRQRGVVQLPLLGDGQLAGVAHAATVTQGGGDVRVIVNNADKVVKFDLRQPRGEQLRAATVLAAQFGDVPAGHTRLFHGTTIAAATSILADGIDTTQLKTACDFGAAFYLTPQLAYAAECAYARTNRTNDDAAVIAFDVPDDALASLQQMNVTDLAQWRRVIVGCRRGWQSEQELKNQYRRADVVIGKVCRNAGAVDVKRGVPQQMEDVWQTALRTPRAHELIENRELVAATVLRLAIGDDVWGALSD